MRKLLILMLLLSLAWTVDAQERQITGVVMDDENSTLIGVNILVKGTTVGTVTGVNGDYTIQAKEGETIMFSYIGYQNVEKVVGVENVINVIMLQDAESLQEVVVTALGFKEQRDKMSSTYSKIEADKVLQRGENKVIDGIAGKASGVRISATSGDPGSGANIQIRGQNTITGSSQPLIIVDGVPLNNDWLRGSGSEDDAGVSQQSRLNDINPDDIESFQIYKGASAGALYGTRAMNGAIVITTKKGKKGEVKASYTSSISIDNISYKHPLQKSFGQGTDGDYSATSAFSWGDRISDRPGGPDDVNTTGQFFESLVSDNIIYPITGKNSTDVFVDSNFDQIFRTGVSFDNKISLSGGGERGTFYLSAGRVDQNGIIRESDYRKTNFTVSTSQKLTNKLTANVKGNYIHSTSDRIQQGSNTAGIYLGLLRTPPDFDVSDYIGNYHSSSGIVTESRQRSYRRYLGNNDNAIYNNPLWTVYEQTNTSKVNRYIGTGELNYDANDYISLILRGGADIYYDNRIYLFPYYTAGTDRRFGLLRDETFLNQEYNMDILGSFRYPITDKIGSNIVVGFGVNDRRRKRDYIEADNFIANFRDVFDPNEVSRKENISGTVERTLRNNIRLYGTAAFDYDDQVYLTIGGAYEKHSSLNDPFFYPTVELGWVFTKLMEKPDWMTFGKLRLAFGQVGNVPLPHRSQTVYEVGSFSTFSDEITLEDFGGGYQLDERLGNPDLKPEIKTEYEAGLDLRFLRNRLFLSATYYQNKIKDALLDIALTPSLGFDEIYGNGADIENKGFEIETGYNFIKRENWRAGVSANISSNKNEVTRVVGGGVVNLAPGSSIQSVAIEGHPIGVFYTQGALRDENGMMILDENGFPQVDLTGNLVVGDPNPDWRGGLGFNFGYKNLNVNILFETSQGNDIGERTRFITSYFGTHADVENEVTLSQDLVNYDGNTIAAGTTVRGNIENFGAGDVLLDETYYTNLWGFGDGKLNEFAVHDGSWTRLREVSLSYKIDGEWLKKSGLGSIELTASGRNLVIWTDVVGIDPDINQFGVGQGQGLDYFTNPGSRTYSFSIKLNY